MRSDGRDNFLDSLIIAGNYSIPEVIRHPSHPDFEICESENYWLSPDDWFYPVTFLLHHSSIIGMYYCMFLCKTVNCKISRRHFGAIYSVHVQYVHNLFCSWRCEHARFCVEKFYALYINFHSFIHSTIQFARNEWTTAGELTKQNRSREMYSPIQQHIKNF